MLSRKEVGFLSAELYTFSPAQIQKFIETNFPLSFQPGEKVVELHLPSERSAGGVSLTDIKKSILALADFVQAENLPEETKILAASHISKFLARYGFNIQELSDEHQKGWHSFHYLSGQKSSFSSDTYKKARSFIEPLKNIPGSGTLDKVLSQKEVDARMREKFSSEHITLASQTVRTLKEWAAKNKPQIEEAASEKETGS
jgi:hypothetical protein